MENIMKHEKFKSLAEARTTKTMKQIRLIGNLSNKSSYDYTQDEVTAIFTALEAEMDKAKSRFNNARDLDDATKFILG